MKIILSRKGNGKKPSPIFENGDFFFLPIPQDDAGSIPYSNINYQGHNFGKVVEDLTKGNIKAGDKCHFDPDLEVSSLPRLNGWKPMFGQSGAPQGHLQNQGIEKGDLFIFYGTFRKVSSENDKYAYEPSENEFHAIFGWLQVEDIISVYDAHKIPAWAKYHPHFARIPNPANNDDVVYVASEKLTLPNKSINLGGGGMIKKFKDNLILSKRDKTKGLWDLPAFFYPENNKPMLTYNPDLSKWTKNGDRCMLETSDIGQEFVLDANYYPEVFDWLAGLLENK